MCIYTGAHIPVLNAIKIPVPQGPQAWRLFPGQYLIHTRSVKAKYFFTVYFWQHKTVSKQHYVVHP